MVPAKRTQSDNWFQKEILEKLLEVKKAVDESLQLGRENGESIRSLRKELGVDGSHGRLPELDRSIARLDRQQEDDHRDILERLAPLERHSSQLTGGSWVVNRMVEILTSSVAAGIILAIAKAMGWIH